MMSSPTLTLTKTDAEHEWLHALADAQVAAFTGGFVAAAQHLAAQVTEADVAIDLSQPGDPSRLFKILDGWQVTKARRREPTDLYTGILSTSATRTSQSHNVALESSLTMTSRRVLDAAEQLGAELIVGVRRETKVAVRRIIKDAWRDGTSPRDTAILIRDVIGLDQRRAIALANYRKATAGKPNAGALGDKYAKRLLRNRATVIARTETMKAANTGRQLAWKEMQAQGQLAPGFVQEWYTTPDDRLCPVCAPMAGQQVTLGNDFVSRERGVLPSERVAYSGGVTEQPPLHPQCRCVLVARFT